MKKLVLFAAVVVAMSLGACKKTATQDSDVQKSEITEQVEGTVNDVAPQGDNVDGQGEPEETPENTPVE